MDCITRRFLQTPFLASGLLDVDALPCSTTVDCSVGTVLDMCACAWSFIVTMARPVWSTYRLPHSHAAYCCMRLGSCDLSHLSLGSAGTHSFCPVAVCSSAHIRRVTANIKIISSDIVYFFNIFPDTKF
jgi:hypothetical protein